MALICKAHALTTDHVAKLLELVDGEIKDSRAATAVTNEELADLFQLRTVVSAIGATPAAAKKAAGKRTAKKATAEAGAQS